MLLTFQIYNNNSYYSNHVNSWITTIREQVILNQPWKKEPNQFVFFQPANENCMLPVHLSFTLKKTNKPKTNLGLVFVPLTTTVKNRKTVLTCIFCRCKATRTAVSMRWSAPLIASGATVRGIAVWGKPGTTSGWVLTLTSSTLWQPGRNVAACTFRRSCVAPLCCCMLRPSLPAQVRPEYVVILA